MIAAAEDRQKECVSLCKRIYIKEANDVSLQNSSNTATTGSIIPARIVVPPLYLPAFSVVALSSVPPRIAELGKPAWLAEWVADVGQAIVPAHDLPRPPLIDESEPGGGTNLLQSNNNNTCCII